MDHIQTLVRSVVRAFYSTLEILVVDALVTHSALRDDELAYLMKMNLKDLHRLCATLRDARFLVVHTRPEMQAGKTRPINRTYYFVDYRQTVDAIKWRVYKMDKDMQSTAKPADESKEYSCPRAGCGARWSQMEVLDSVSAAGFTCQRCGAVLERSKEREAPGHQQLSLMNNQFKFITDMLQEIDRTAVPECTFDRAMQAHRPVVREPTHEVLASIPVDINKPTAVKGLANTGPKTIQVTISDGNAEQEKLENKRKREQFLQQNALPSWITESSVPASSFGGNSDAAAFSFSMKEDDNEKPGKRVKLEVEDEEEELEFEDVV